ncbi:hypothetical protein [Psychrobacter sanguinis]|uniref:hypothetical protein n=1 Tax=Psychrobacter sanguinis TaxID=861445 RepID=UPI00191AF6EB|nr:hypothetical protein [Psychrobacter sanguinis]MCC3307525.1 hypothetical protein [Psychrobacter sanguinis]
MNKEQAKQHLSVVSSELTKTRQFMREFAKFDTKQSDVAQFDSMIAANSHDREMGLQAIPESLQKLLEAQNIAATTAGKQAVFDGLRDGIAEYQRRNGGDMPPVEVVQSALSAATAFTENAHRGDDNDPSFDSLSFSHHEALSVVPAAVQVVITMGIANSLPLISMLPNPTGSNEVPIVAGEGTAGMDMGVMRRGELIDGEKAGLPYFDNRHLLVMEDAGEGKFTLESHVAYTKEIRDNKTTKFVVDKDSIKAPFLGGRVSIKVRGVEVANDNHRNHPTFGGKSTLQPLEPVTLGADTFIVKSAVADLDNHTVEVAFDTNDGATPKADEVEVELIFDYERKDEKGEYILRAPSHDMAFNYYGVYAYPSRARSSATIDAITQLQNELGINWYAAAQMIFINKYNFEQNGRLLRGAVNQCLANQEKHVKVFDADIAGVTHTTLTDLYSNIRVVLGKARTALSTITNTAIGQYDLYVSDRGAAFFEAMSRDEYTPTGEQYGDQYSIYRIGQLNTGANIYYVPASMGVFNEDELTQGGYALLVPRATTPAKAPFVGTVAVPTMVLASSANAFEKDVAVYNRMAAEANPIPRYRNQCMLIELRNLPTL